MESPSLEVTLDITCGPTLLESVRKILVMNIAVHVSQMTIREFPVLLAVTTIVRVDSLDIGHQGQQFGMTPCGTVMGVQMQVTSAVTDTVGSIVVYLIEVTTWKFACVQMKAK